MAVEGRRAHGADAGMIVADLFGVDEQAAVEFGDVGIFVDVVEAVAGAVAADDDFLGVGA